MQFCYLNDMFLPSSTEWPNSHQKTHMLPNDLSAFWILFYVIRGEGVKFLSFNDLKELFLLHIHDNRSHECCGRWSSNYFSHYLKLYSHNECLSYLYSVCVLYKKQNNGHVYLPVLLRSKNNCVTLSKLLQFKPLGLWFQIFKMGTTGYLSHMVFMSILEVSICEMLKVCLIHVKQQIQ